MTPQFYNHSAQTFVHCCRVSFNWHRYLHVCVWVAVAQQIAGGLIHLTDELDKFTGVHWISNLEVKSDGCHGDRGQYHSGGLGGTRCFFRNLRHKNNHSKKILFQNYERPMVTMSWKNLCNLRSFLNGFVGFLWDITVFVLSDVDGD